MKRKKSGNAAGAFLKMMLGLAAFALLFAGGRWFGQGIATGEFGLETLPVFSAFFKEDEPQPEVGEVPETGPEVDEPETEPDPKEEDKAIDILLMGIDARSSLENSRSDTMILLSVDAENQQVAMISIPRDTKVTTPKGVTEKINAVNFIEGPEAASEVVGELFGIQVDHYAVVNFNSFRNIVDIMGGVDLYVDMNMYHADPVNPELEIELFQGQRHLNGDQALQYVRYRGGQTADIGRTQRQQKFLKALADKMFSIGAVKKIPDLWDEVKKGIRTDLTITDVTSLVKVASALQEAEINTQTVPGYSGMFQGASYWLTDDEVLKTLVKDVRSGQTINVSGDPKGVGTTRAAAEAAAQEAAAEAALNSAESAGLGDLEAPLPPSEGSETSEIPLDFATDGTLNQQEILLPEAEPAAPVTDPLPQEEPPAAMPEDAEPLPEIPVDMEPAPNDTAPEYWIEVEGVAVDSSGSESPLGDLTEPLAPTVPGVDTENIIQ